MEDLITNIEFNPFIGEWGLIGFANIEIAGQFLILNFKVFKKDEEISILPPKVKLPLGAYRTLIKYLNNDFQE